jgi:hypothetical protein
VVTPAVTITPQVRRQAGTLLAGSCATGEAEAELAGRAAVAMTDGLGLTPEQQVMVADRLACVAAVAAGVLKAVTPPGMSIGLLVDVATDMLVRMDLEEGR